MTNSARALQRFFGSFGIPAYDEQSVPDNAMTPYITHQSVDAEWDEVFSVSATVWYSGTSLADIFGKVDEIKAKVQRGCRVPVDSGGCVWVYPDTPFAQVQDSGVDNVKAVYLLFSVHALCN